MVLTSLGSGSQVLQGTTAFRMQCMQISSYRLLLAPIGLIGFYYWLLLAPIGSYWLLLAPVGSYWLLLLPIGSHWLLVVPIGPYWILMAPNCSYWLLLAPIGSLLLRFKICSRFPFIC